MSLGGTQAAAPTSENQDEAQRPQGQNESALLGVADPNASQNRGSGSFTNLNKYIEANKPQTSQMAQGIVKNVGQKSGQLRTDLTKKGEQFTQFTNPELQRLQTAGQTISPIIQKAGILAEGEKAPTEGIAGLTKEQSDAFKNLYNKTGEFQNYQAPDTSPEQYRAQSLQNLAQSSKTSLGREQLLRDQFQRPTYTQGQSALDNLLLQGDKANRTSLIQGIGQQTKSLGSDVQNLRKQALERLTNIEQQAGVAQTEAQTALTEANKQKQAELEERKKQDYLANVMSNYAAQQGMTQAQYDKFKQLTGYDTGRTYGVNNA